MEVELPFLFSNFVFNFNYQNTQKPIEVQKILLFMTQDINIHILLLESVNLTPQQEERGGNNNNGYMQ